MNATITFKVDGGDNVKNDVETINAVVKRVLRYKGYSVDMFGLNLNEADHEILLRFIEAEQWLGLEKISVSVTLRVNDERAKELDKRFPIMAGGSWFEYWDGSLARFVKATRETGGNLCRTF